MEKERLDLLLVEKGLFESRERARGTIMAGVVYINGERADKPGGKYPKDSLIEIKENPNPYVSRGGLKLEKALNEFKLDLNGKKALDIGASTGGFTDCMLKNGAAMVAAIDVGYGQLAWSLRQDSRVKCMERTNIRYVKYDDIGFDADFSTVDVSFISLKKVLPVLKDLLTQSGEVVCLIKPQFEAGREKVGKHGVVRDPAVHSEVVADIICFAYNLGFTLKGITFSPIKGPEGNIEYLAYLSKDNSGCSIDEALKRAQNAVNESHEQLNAVK